MIYEIAQVAEKIGLTRAGNEWKGPCPVCGGTDRFWIKTGDRKPMIMNCRQGCTYSEIRNELDRQGIYPNDERISTQAEYLKGQKKDRVSFDKLVGEIVFVLTSQYLNNLDLSAKGEPMVGLTEDDRFRLVYYIKECRERKLTAISDRIESLIEEIDEQIGEQTNG